MECAAGRAGEGPRRLEGLRLKKTSLTRSPPRVAPCPVSPPQADPGSWLTLKCQCDVWLLQVSITIPGVGDGSGLCLVPENSLGGRLGHPWLMGPASEMRPAEE